MKNIIDVNKVRCILVWKKISRSEKTEEHFFMSIKVQRREKNILKILILAPKYNSDSCTFMSIFYCYLRQQNWLLNILSCWKKVFLNKYAYIQPTVNSAFLIPLGLGNLFIASLFYSSRSPPKPTVYRNSFLVKM